VFEQVVIKASDRETSERFYATVLGAFWRAGVDAGYRDDGSPGPRPQYTADYYGAFLLDPDGNSAEAVHHGGLRRGGTIDHLWVRVADVAAARRSYEAVAARAGLRLEGPPTENIDVTFL
jgi:catechol 2,3-dioxygenase-like lactoylglutathione lyase family enzyme